jgi:hypothetical protein
MAVVNIPRIPIPEKVSVYIDGFNLYFGIRGSGLGRLLWLDLVMLSKNLIRPHQTLTAVRYFTARIMRPEAKRRRQNAHLDALGSLDASLFSISFGNYQQNQTSCPHCGGVYDVPNEKQTDVNIAVSMLADAHKDLFDVALLISADSDLCPVVSAVRSLFPKKRVIAMFPPGRASKELAKTVTACFTIGLAKLRQSQFPNVVTLPDGFQITKPSLWNDAQYQKPH